MAKPDIKYTELQVRTPDIFTSAILPRKYREEGFAAVLAGRRCLVTLGLWPRYVEKAENGNLLPIAAGSRAGEWKA